MKVQAVSLRAIDANSTERERPVRAEEKRGRGERIERGPNYRGLYNRVINSDLERSEKAKFIERIKNAAASEESRPEPTSSASQSARRRYLAEA